MSKGRESIYVRCPYYCREDRKLMQLRCEGIIEGTELYQRFGSGAEMRSHKDQYCQGAYRSCPLAAALDRKYDYV